MTETKGRTLAEALLSGDFPEEYLIRDFLESGTAEDHEFIRKKALLTREKYYHNKIYLRGLLEFTNYCKKDCYYCGLRSENGYIKRYRLLPDEIISTCKVAYNKGFKTFVLQGGEDPLYSDNQLCKTVYKIRSLMPNVAVTLSAGEKPERVYRDFFSAGATRYLLRHETATPGHYKQIHPGFQKFEDRMSCLYNLKEIGFQTGVGFMVGSPYQTMDNIIKDLQFIYEFDPEMVGIGPFIPAEHTPFAKMPKGSAKLTANLLSIIRIMKPKVLLPSTTALATAESDEKRLSSGHSAGILAGANVIMPNISPEIARKNYRLYNGKLSTGLETSDGLSLLTEEMKELGFEISMSKGDHPDFIK